MKSKKNALIATLLSVASVSCVISAFAVNAASKANKTIQLTALYNGETVDIVGDAVEKNICRPKETRRRLTHCLKISAAMIGLRKLRFRGNKTGARFTPYIYRKIKLLKMQPLKKFSDILLCLTYIICFPERLIIGR